MRITYRDACNSHNIIYKFLNLKIESVDSRKKQYKLRKPSTQILPVSKYEKGAEKSKMLLKIRSLLFPAKTTPYSS